MADRSLREALERQLDSMPTLNYENGYPVQALPKSELLDLLELHPEPAGLVVTDQGVEAAAKAMYHFVEGETARWHRTSSTADYYRDEAREALEAAVPFLQGPETHWSDLETEYAVDYDAGHTHVSTDRADAEEFVQWMVNGRLVRRTVARTEWTEVRDG